MAKPGFDERMQRLGAEIEAMRAKLGKRRNFENDDIGDLLSTINDDLHQVAHDDPAAHARYDRIEARLDAVRARLDAAED
jgi:hypothetical protein